ncbi:hypothetical protein B5X24_HaOG202630 [Helicoverpa armigera]|uniref:Hemolin n=1 Tax=Helicoverpa armigera TaxID=29058 RepID=A0A2W1BWS1_HELAM|nr:hypothetical protein B5X24_HaOG202630 [Helicoverpa armigera]
MSWLNNGAAIDLSDLDSRFYLVGSGSLRVQSARALDAGAYTCRAHNRLDSADHSTQLHVLTPPRVTLPGGPVVTARARGDVTLRCEARGRPPPSVAWLKDGDPLTPNNHDIALVDGSSLRIQGVLRVDAGMFQCVASSPAGQAVAALRLRVLPPDDGLELERDNGTAVSAPRGLRAVIVKHRFVTLSWEPPAQAEGDLTGYAVVYRVKGSERERVSRGVAGRHEMNVASLQPNTTYLFSVRAYTDQHTSPPSDTIEVRTSEEEITHGPPVGLRGEALGPHALRLAWSPPVAAPPPTKYSIQYTEVDSGREQFQWVEADASATSISSTVSGLRAASAYLLRVAAAGGAAAELRLRTPSDAPAAPPANVTVVATSATSILVRWEAPPARTHRGPLTGYKVRYRAAAPESGPAPAPGPGGPRRKADSLTTPADQRRAELRGLDTATTYQIRVCAINANGSGPFSEWVSASTQRHELDESRVPPQPPPLTTRAGRDWISVWWGEEVGGVVVRGYVLGWGLGVPDDAARDLPAHLHSHVIRGLESNAEYVISLRASNSRGLGPAVYATVRTRAPADDDAEPDDEDDDDDDEVDEPPPLIPPVGVKVIMLSGTTAVVYWTDPTLPKGQTATDGRRYVVRWSSAGGRARTFNATDLNCMLDELRPFTQYEFAVKLIKGGRESAWSMLVSNTTLEAAPGSPPRELRPAPAPPPASPARAVDLTWQPPAKPNGLITGMYEICYRL